MHERTVRDALDAKYKNRIKSAEALQQQQNTGRGINYRDQQQVIKKPVEQITLEDLKLADFPKSKLKQLAKHVMEKNLFIEQQDKQNKDKEQTKTQEQFTAEFTMRFEESMMEDLLGIKLREEEKRTYVGKYYYLVAVKVKVDSIEGKVELIPPVVIMSKKLSDPEDRKKANS